MSGVDRHRGASARFRNLVRSGRGYYQLSARIAEQVLLDPSPASYDLPPHLSPGLFRIHPESWTVANFDDADFRALARIRREGTPAIDLAFMTLAVDYLRCNVDHIETLQTSEYAVSSSLIRSDFSRTLELHDQLDPIDRQSIFAVKLNAALRSNSDENILAALSNRKNSNWFRSRLFFPLAYYFLHVPLETAIETQLSHVFGSTGGNAAEKKTIAFLLRDEAVAEESLAFKLFIGLLCHPYDMREMILSHFEAEVSAGRPLRSELLELLRTIVELLPYDRATDILALCERKAIAFAHETPAPAFAKSLGLDTSTTEYLRRLVDNEPPGDFTEAGVVLKALAGNRDRRYPDVRDFEVGVTFCRRYHFTSAGRFSAAYMTSLYMIPRRTVEVEVRELHRLTAFLGAITAFIGASPRARSAIRAGTLAAVGLSHEVLQHKVDLGLRKPEAYQDRMWIKAAHWYLHEIEQRGRIKEWMARVRQYLPFRPGYLSGIDWDWWRQTKLARKMNLLAGNTDAIFVLFHELLEERALAGNTLRLACEPVARRLGNSDAFVKWLVSQFGDSARLYVRFFLTAEMILWLRLVPNYAAALSQRMNAISTVVHEFGLDESDLNQDHLESEQKAYTAALLLLNVDDDKFSISWSAIARDAFNRHEDIFKTYRSFQSDEQIRNASAGKSSTNYDFHGGRSASYDVKGVDWPLALVVLSYIDTFLAHPAHGLESILAVRMRHTEFRRQFASAIEELEQAEWKELPVEERRRLLPMFSEVIKSAGASWADQYLRHKRDNRPLGLFDMVPSQKELTSLLNQLGSPDSFSEVSAVVNGFLRSKLKTQLENAKAQLSSDLKSKLDRAVDERRDRLTTGMPGDPSVDAAAKALKNVNRQAIRRISEWFRLPETDGVNLQAPLADLGLAVSARFERELSSGQILLSGPSTSETRITPRDEHVRLIFELWGELVQNALKHGDGRPIRLRVRLYENSGQLGFIATTLMRVGADDIKAYPGHPYKSASEEMLSDVRSGMHKIAALAASTYGQAVTVKGVRRRRAYHAVVPLRSSGSRQTSSGGS